MLAGGREGPPGDATAFVAHAEARAADARALMARIAGTSGSDGAAPGAPSLDALTRAVEPGRALLVYELADPRSSVWAVTSAGWRRFELPAGDAIAAKIDTLRALLVKPDLAVSPEAQRLERRLYMMLLASPEPLFRAKLALTIVPDGALWLLPFETLLTVEPELKKEPPKHGYVIERWSVAYAMSAAAGAPPPSAGVLGGVLALGDPLYERGDEAGDGPTLPALPKTAAELAAVDQQARGRERVALVGADATRERLMAEPLLADAGVIHLATHTVAVDAEPERSGLWLATDGRDGPTHLSARDIMKLDLRARLVALTECETSDVGPDAGRGLRALAGAFFDAGAKQVMPSLWKPIDRSTGLLLDRFYRDYLRKGFTAPDALADAKRQMLKKPETRSPFLWAPLVVIEGGAP